MYWGRSEEFIPERFLKTDIDIDEKNFTLLPFGSGRRRCPGYIPWNQACGDNNG